MSKFYNTDEKLLASRNMLLGTTVVHNVFDGTISGTTQTIWNVGGVYVYPTSASPFTLVSTSVNDTATGTGARTVILFGLDSSYNSISETITMNGTTPVTTTLSYLRWFRLRITSVGSNETNVGVIDLKQSTNILARIDVGEGQSQSSVNTIPAGKTGYLYQIQLSSAKNTDGYISLITRENGVLRNRHKEYIDSNNTLINFPFPTPLFEKTDIELRGIAVVGAGTIGGTYDYLLIDNP